MSMTIKNQKTEDLQKVPTNFFKDNWPLLSASLYGVKHEKNAYKCNST